MAENNIADNATVVAEENQKAVETTASVEQGKFTFTDLKGESKPYDSLEQLFRKGKKDEDAARQERKQYFGSWIAEVKDGEAIDPEALIKKIEEKKEELNHYISNLSKLKGYAEELVARQKAEQLAATVGKMTDAEFEALKEAVASRERLVAQFHQVCHCLEQIEDVPQLVHLLSFCGCKVADITIRGMG